MRISDIKPVMWILSDEWIKHSNRKTRYFIKFLIDLGRIAFFYYQILFLLIVCFYIKMKTQASILMFRCVSISISLEFTW